VNCHHHLTTILPNLTSSWTNISNLALVISPKIQKTQDSGMEHQIGSFDSSSLVSFPFLTGNEFRQGCAALLQRIRDAGGAHDLGWSSVKWTEWVRSLLYSPVSVSSLLFPPFCASSIVYHGPNFILGWLLAFILYPSKHISFSFSYWSPYI